MEGLDTLIRNLHANICASSFETVLAPVRFSCFYMFRENAYNFVRTTQVCYVRFMDIKQNGVVFVALQIFGLLSV